MEPIDWTKPIELMNGEFRRHSLQQALVRIDGGDIPTAWFYTDRQGCIGGVQVVRNRKEPVKKTVYIYMDPNSQIFICPLSNALEYFYTKILVWRDAKGKTRVEVCDD